MNETIEMRWNEHEKLNETLHAFCSEQNPKWIYVGVRDVYHIQYILFNRSPQYDGETTFS